MARMTIEDCLPVVAKGFELAAKACGRKTRSNDMMKGRAMTVRRLIDGKGNFVSIIDPDVKVQDVMDQLERDEVSALVVSRDKRTMLGIISAGDVVRGLNRIGPEVVERCVRDLMTTQVVCCDIGEPINKIYELMDAHQIRHVPITENGELCGIISILDVVKYRLAEIEAEAEALKDYVAGRT